MQHPFPFLKIPLHGKPCLILLQKLRWMIFMGKEAMHYEPIFFMIRYKILLLIWNLLNNYGKNMAKTLFQMDEMI
jgi:hypothetical protein